MALQMQNNLFQKVDDLSESPTPEMASPSAKRIRLSPNTSSHSDGSIASTSQGGSSGGEEKSSPNKSLFLKNDTETIIRERKH
ncbi:hypothetical protein CAEBREN_21585 [Caenorhabditis brenneri]|uniref:Uncharacterized protein n=1 Tax=Caenorhabditis brenneri TaxID=135651 RepID=G0NA26_CAEBE|nr:hypothetical protein CAEBREN_21585 [Caenorhabditis brenneri]